jgi:hypothetical protein
MLAVYGPPARARRRELPSRSDARPDRASAGATENPVLTSPVSRVGLDPVERAWSRTVTRHAWLDRRNGDADGVSQVPGRSRSARRGACVVRLHHRDPGVTREHRAAARGGRDCGARATGPSEGRCVRNGAAGHNRCRAREDPEVGGVTYREPSDPHNPSGRCGQCGRGRYSPDGRDPARPADAGDRPPPRGLAARDRYCRRSAPIATGVVEAGSAAPAARPPQHEPASDPPLTARQERTGSNRRVPVPTIWLA